MKPKQILTFALIIGAIAYFALYATKQMKKILALFLLSFISVNSFSQYSVKWSELMPVKGRVSSVFPVSYSDFYTTRYMGPRMFPTLWFLWKWMTNGFFCVGLSGITQKAES